MVEQVSVKELFTKNWNQVLHSYLMPDEQLHVALQPCTRALTLQQSHTRCCACVPGKRHFVIKLPASLHLVRSSNTHPETRVSGRISESFCTLAAQHQWHVLIQCIAYCLCVPFDH